MLQSSLGRRYYFKAIHSIPQEPLVHGHDYQLDLQIEGEIQEGGMLISRDLLDQIVQTEFIEKVNQRWVNNSIELATGESLILMAHKVISKALPNKLKLKSLELKETEKNSFFTICP